MHYFSKVKRRVDDNIEDTEDTYTQKHIHTSQEQKLFTLVTQGTGNVPVNFF